MADDIDGVSQTVVEHRPYSPLLPGLLAATMFVEYTPRFVNRNRRGPVTKRSFHFGTRRGDETSAGIWEPDIRHLIRAGLELSGTANSQID